MSTLLERLKRHQTRIEGVLERCLAAAAPSAPARLHQAMCYSVLGGGKRLRPMLVYTAGEALGAPLARLDPSAAAVELVHVYSLVHDDLPAMDDDDLRRGRPTCHRAFDEATAILAGDALQALAFGVLARSEDTDLPPAARIETIRLLAHASGTAGMAGGQQIDLQAVGGRLSLETLEDMHRRKTGALIEASVLLGATVAGITAGRKREALRVFGAEIGLAFQIQDDVLDVAGDPATLGKATGMDAARRKPTYPSTVGLAAARARALELRERAVAALEPLGADAAPLAELAHFMVERAL